MSPPHLYNLSLTGESFSGKLIRNLTGEDITIRGLAILPKEPELEKPRLLKRGLVTCKGRGSFAVSTLDKSYPLPKREDSVLLLVQPIVAALHPEREDLFFPTRSPLCAENKYDGFGCFKTYSQLFNKD